MQIIKKKHKQMARRLGRQLGDCCDNFSRQSFSLLAMATKTVAAWSAVCSNFAIHNALLTKREIKMAGYWCSSFFTFLWTEKIKSMKMQKKGTRPISSHLDRTSMVNKGFIIWPKDYINEFCFCRNKAGNPKGARQAHLPTGGASHIKNMNISRGEAMRSGTEKRCSHNLQSGQSAG